MKYTVSLLLISTVELVTPSVADACGVKLTVKSSAPRKSVPRSSNPSQILLVGAPPRRLQNDLTVAGHKVEVAQTPQGAQRDRYAVVIADEAQANAARERFGDNVIVRTGDVRNDMVAVEGRVTRKPVAVATARTPVAAKPDREVVAAGPTREEKAVVASKPAEPVEPPAPTPPPTPAPTPAPPPETTRVAAATPTPAPKAPRSSAVDAASINEEVFFGVNSARVGSTRALTRTVQWLTANDSVSVVVEGHADPTGTPDGNMRLSQTRAEAVRDFLVEKGIATSRIEVKALGDTQLKYGARDGRNRRVVIQATK